jgi:GMP synthase (glutamine-hydrolysing)
MALTHIAVIDPAIKVAELDCFNKISLKTSSKVSYHLPALFGIDSLTELDESISAFIILGSSSSVHDRFAWQGQLETWLRPQLEKGKPTLGLCYGHQMLAHMFGGTVDFLFSDRHKLQGFRKIKLEKNPLWKNQTLEGKVYVSHREGVVECPNSMQIIASSSEVKIEGLAHNRLPVWSFQSHPESTPLFLKNMGDRHNVDAQAFDFGTQIIDYFLTHVQGS